MKRLVLNGRRESFRLGNIDIVLDVAHNPDAAVELRKFLDRQTATQTTTAIFAVMSDKDCRDMIAASSQSSMNGIYRQVSAERAGSHRR